MYIEDEFFQMFQKATPFLYGELREYWEYQKMLHRYGEGRRELERVLDKEHRELMNQMISDQCFMGIFKDLHWFREGVRMERKRQEQEKSRDP